MNRSLDQNQARQALEALRNGVPNPAAVELLGCSQPAAERQFQLLLSQVMDSEDPVPKALGMLVSGGFGSGKSHLLAHLEHQALSQGFVCSRIAISKETPLYQLEKVFKSSVDNGRIPGQTGPLMEEIGHGINTDSDEYTQFVHSVNSERSGLSPMFPATLAVHEWSDDQELRSEIRSFWSGERIKVSRVKDGLKQIRQLQNYPFKQPKASELHPQRLRFAIQLIKGAGFKGWVVLLDELELVGSYSLLQRAKSYAEIARWMGLAVDEAYPGLVVVGAVTEEFASVILGTGGKNDRDYVGTRLISRNMNDVAARAEAGMRAIERNVTQLAPPTDEGVKSTLEKLRQIYTTAYCWDAPATDKTAGGVGYRGMMRYKIRASINEWDLMRLYPDARPETVVTEFHSSYTEDPALGPELEDEPGEDKLRI